MNKAETTDFFPDLDDYHSSLVAPNIFQVYRETEEDLRHEERLRQVEIKLLEHTGPKQEWGNLFHNEETDRQRWKELEKDFDRVFNEGNYQ